LRSHQAVVVGSGIVGAAIAYRLAMHGHDVQILERHRQCAAGVTSASFGWVNLVNGTPSDRDGFALRLAAIEEYRRLRAELPHAFETAIEGALVWKSKAKETRALATALRDAGVALDLVGASRFAQLEPGLREFPSCAILAVDDLAFDPVQLAGALIKAASMRGAELRCGVTVRGLRLSGGRVTGVETDHGPILADRVVLAAGPQTAELLAPLGIDLDLRTSRALLLRFHAPDAEIQRVLSGPKVEVRPAGGGNLTVAADWPGAGEVERVARYAETAIGQLLGIDSGIEFLGAEIGERPTFGDGLPRYGPVPGLDACNFAVGHPGVILAPLLGRLVADEVTKRELTF
jgi:glycine/D-amino acid oxidase-like deaminating enzyme